MKKGDLVYTMQEYDDGGPPDMILGEVLSDPVEGTVSVHWPEYGEEEDGVPVERLHVLDFSSLEELFGDEEDQGS